MSHRSPIPSANFDFAIFTSHLPYNLHIPLMKAESEIKWPQQDVVSRAISTVVEGICTDNHLDIQYSGIDSTDMFPAGCLPTIGDALKAAKARMNDHMDQLIAHLAHLWNRASSVHRLPVDILAIIFEEFELSPPHRDSSLLNVLPVCRTWYDTATGSPKLWRKFGSLMPPNIVRLVIDRSQSLPISVDWYAWNRSHLSEGSRDTSKVLDLALENSMRLKEFDAHLGPRCGSDARKLLEAPTPVLETLRVRVPKHFSDHNFENLLDRVVLSEGPHLKHLSLCNIPIPLGSPRLANLISLTLRGSSVPQSFELFLHSSSSSQRLEALRVYDTEYVTGEYLAYPLVVLLQLRELVLSDVSSVYVAAILASIYTPSCSHVEVTEWTASQEDSEAVEALDAVIWRPGNDQAAVLVGGTGPNIIPGSLSIRIHYRWITITIGSLESSQGHRKLHFARINVPQIVAQLSTTFSQLPSPPAVHLHRNDTDTTEYSLVDLLPWSELLDSLLMEGSHSCRSVLQQSSWQHVLPGTGGGDWICGRLSSIKLVYRPGDEEDVALDGGALLSLVRQRWSDEDGLAGASRPTSFEIHCTKVDFPNLWSLEGEITRVLPSFKLIAIDD
ncbi:hypothetical protein M407DRAFT_33070 [Tulasnella calospora MUT 4182]|uniref:F-box domain-containing protein n=1 Tax=Tulasnella calospora MUT 4182 TaxID=1051891 RepID=A0A0C3PRK3_9AGAM|nr:hypothetical protein M407DRAFT_33070 [Tulasnella calospora MUT 4182]